MTLFKSTDPATEATNWEGEAASPVQVQAAVDAARAAFPDWADRPRQDRIDAVKRYQAVLKDRAPQIAEAIARETGKPLWETKTEAAAMIGKVDISIRAYDERTGERSSDTRLLHDGRHDDRPHTRVLYRRGELAIDLVDHECGGKIAIAAGHPHHRAFLAQLSQHAVNHTSTNHLPRCHRGFSILKEMKRHHRSH